MKLRNKKTGEIVRVEFLNNWQTDDGTEIGFRECNSNIVYSYTSLAELNEEWEDYEETKKYWFIDAFGNIVLNEITKHRGDEYTDMTNDYENQKQIGNYFETKEEAEKAAEKLKAWKRLKDECDIKFDGIIRDDKAMLKGVKLSYDRDVVTFARMQECMNALHLLFGGEE